MNAVAREVRIRQCTQNLDKLDELLTHEFVDEELLRDLAGEIAAEVRRLRSENAALQADAALGKMVREMEFGWELCRTPLSGRWFVSKKWNTLVPLIPTATPEEALSRASE